jgi:hypothetical protein
MQTTDRELTVKVPRSLAGKDIRGAIALGLFYVASGRRPAFVPNDETVAQRIKLNATAEKHLPHAAKSFGGEREAIVAALAWVNEQPHYLRSASIN